MNREIEGLCAAVSEVLRRHIEDALLAVILRILGLVNREGQLLERGGCGARCRLNGLCVDHFAVVKQLELISVIKRHFGVVEADRDRLVELNLVLRVIGIHADVSDEGGAAVLTQGEAVGLQRLILIILQSLAVLIREFLLIEILGERLGYGDRRADGNIGNGDGSAVLDVQHAVAGGLCTVNIACGVLEIEQSLTAAEIDVNGYGELIALTLVAAVETVSQEVNGLFVEGHVRDNGCVDKVGFQLGKLIGVARVCAGVGKVTLLCGYGFNRCVMTVFIELPARCVVLIDVLGGVLQNAVSSGLDKIDVVIDLEQVRDHERLSVLQINAALAGLVVYLTVNIIAEAIIGIIGTALGSKGKAGKTGNRFFQTLIDLGGINLLGNDEVIAERSHGEGHIAVTLNHTALHVEYVHGVGVRVIKCELCRAA